MCKNNIEKKKQNIQIPCVGLFFEICVVFFLNNMSEPL